METWVRITSLSIEAWKRALTILAFWDSELCRSQKLMGQPIWTNQGISGSMSQKLKVESSWEKTLSVELWFLHVLHLHRNPYAHTRTNKCVYHTDIAHTKKEEEESKGKKKEKGDVWIGDLDSIWTDLLQSGPYFRKEGRKGGMEAGRKREQMRLLSMCILSPRVSGFTWS